MYVPEIPWAKLIETKDGFTIASYLEDFLAADATENSSAVPTSTRSSIHSLPKGIPSDWLPTMKEMTTAKPYASDSIDHFRHLLRAFNAFESIFRDSFQQPLHSPGLPAFLLRPHSALGEKVPPSHAAQREDDGWCLPVFTFLLRRIRTCAVALLAGTGTMKLGLPDEELAELCRSWRKIMVFCTKAETVSKWASSHEGRSASARIPAQLRALPHIVTNLFAVLLCALNLEQCRALLVTVEQFESQGSVTMRSISTQAQWVTYAYYLGRMRMYERNFPGAVSALKSSFMGLPCSPWSPTHNATLILYYLTIAHMLTGVTTSRRLLETHNLMYLADFCDALSYGHLPRFFELTRKHRRDLIQKGAYSFLHLVVPYVLVNTLRRCCLALEKAQEDPARLSVEIIQKLLLLMGAQREVDCYATEEALIASIVHLISVGLVRGYFSYEHKILVLSRQVPFNI